jgi:hypothetical protein
MIAATARAARRLADRAGAGPVAARRAGAGQGTPASAGTVRVAGRASTGAPPGAMVTRATVAAAADLTRRARGPASAVGRADLSALRAVQAAVPLGGLRAGLAPAGAALRALRAAAVGLTGLRAGPAELAPAAVGLTGLRAGPAELAPARAGLPDRRVGLAVPPVGQIGRPGPPAAWVGQAGRAIALDSLPDGETERLRAWIGGRVGRSGRNARRAAAHRPPGARAGRSEPVSGPVTRVGAVGRIGRFAAAVPAPADHGAPVAMKPGGRTVPVTAIAAVAETGPIARPAGVMDRGASRARVSRVAGRRARAPRAVRLHRVAGRRARAEKAVPVHRVAGPRARAGMSSPAQREAGSNGPPDARAPARGRMNIPVGVPTGAPGRPAGPIPETAPTGPSVPGVNSPAATKGAARSIRTSGWTFPTRSPLTSWIRRPWLSYAPCRETWPR